jgi:hypothetical protein
MLLATGIPEDRGFELHDDLSAYISAILRPSNPAPSIPVAVQSRAAMYSDGEGL